MNVQERRDFFRERANLANDHMRPVKERWVRTKAGEALRAQWTGEEEA